MKKMDECSMDILELFCKKFNIELETELVDWGERYAGTEWTVCVIKYIVRDKDTEMKMFEVMHSTYFNEERLALFDTAVMNGIRDRVEEIDAAGRKQFFIGIQDFEAKYEKLKQCVWVSSVL